MHGPARSPASTHGGSDMRRINQRRTRGQGMTEYIIIVALIAVAAARYGIGVGRRLALWQEGAAR